MLKPIHKLYALMWFSAAKKECMKGLNSRCSRCKYYIKFSNHKKYICDLIGDYILFGEEQEAFDKIELFLKNSFKINN